jgi:ribose/xylose/arabinose/galactoside ABC-type transport system permease subunit/ABC-type branched-subunit amino acid transport system ATPase component
MEKQIEKHEDMEIKGKEHVEFQVTRAERLSVVRRLRHSSNQDRPWDFRSRIGLAVCCVAIYFWCGAVYQHFATVSNFFTILLSASSVGIAALGAMFLLISGNIDLSIGGQYALLGVLLGICARDTGNTAYACIMALGGGAISGYINGRLVKMLRINPLIVTLGMGTLLTGFAFVFSGGFSIYGFPRSLVSLGQRDIGPVPIPVLIAGVIFLLCSVVLLKTVLGQRIYAIGGNRAAAHLAGVNVDHYVTGLYVFNGILIGLVALLSSAQVATSSPDVGTTFPLLVLTAVILGGVAFNGGFGHPFGVVVGVFLLSLLDAVVIFANVSSYWQQVVQGAALLVALGSDQVAAYLRRRAAVRARTRRSDEPRDLGLEAPDVDLASPEARRTTPIQGDGRTVFACHGLTKYYGAVCAVRNVSLSLRAGEIMCLAGDNGAGKSTLIQMLSGAIRPDEGSIELDGSPVELTSPGVARALGIATVYQNLALCPNLGAAENLVLGVEPRRFHLGALSWRDDRSALALAKDHLSAVGVQLDDYRLPVRLLSGGQAQSIAIARVVEPGIKVVVLDEPTAALGFRQSRNVRELIRTLAAQGSAVVVISHDVDTVMALADVIVVLRLGEVILKGDPTTITEESLIHAMAGYVPKP